MQFKLQIGIIPVCLETLYSAVCRLGYIFTYSNLENCVLIRLDKCSDNCTFLVHKYDCSLLYLRAYVHVQVHANFKCSNIKSWNKSTLNKIMKKKYINEIIQCQPYYICVCDSVRRET